jgi:uncharacterized protein (TIGR02996 family)
MTFITLSALLCMPDAIAQTVQGCGNLKNPYGPFDYRDPFARAERIPIVDSAHFTPNVERLVKGASGALNHDLDYTLRAVPNHHRALDAVSRYGLQGGRLSNSSIPTVDCYFQRAIAFRPDDETVRMLYANYLVKRGDRTRAIEQYEEALRIAPTAAEVNYNAGLFFLGDGQIERARELAKVAYEAGYPLPGLRNKLAEADKQRH